MKTKYQEPPHTKDYDMFEMHKFNRPLGEKPGLVDSMRRDGFAPSCAIHCVTNGNGKLKIIRGHHRFAIAKRLGLPVYYIVDDSITDIFALEGDSRQSWSVADFAYARAKAGDKHCKEMLAFKDTHGLTFGSAASLMGGESAGSHNQTRAIKSGAFRVGDKKHAWKVVEITDLCRELGIKFATSSGFVHAVSRALRVPEFDSKRFQHSLSLHPHIMNKRSRADEYLEEITGLYNYRRRGKRVRIDSLADDIMRERCRTFGRRNKRNGA